MNASVRDHRAMLRAVHATMGPTIRRRLGEFRRVPRSEYFYELAYCILTPQSSAHNADAVIRILRDRHFADAPFDPEPLLRDKAHYIRFHKTKAVRLLRLLSQFRDIDRSLHDGMAGVRLRDWLVQHVDGFGMKEATHFLRNIGKNDGLAILDRHILRQLVLSGVLTEVPASLTRNRYLEIEKKFVRFARTMQIPLDELDLLFWSLQTGEILK